MLTTSSLPRCRLLRALAVVAPLALVAAPANAETSRHQTQVTFAVDLKGTYSWSLETRKDDAGSRLERWASLDGSFRSRPATITVTYGGGRPTSVVSALPDLVTRSQGAITSRYTPPPGSTSGPHQFTCPVVTTEQPARAALAWKHGQTTEDARFDLRAVDEVRAPVDAGADPDCRALDISLKSLIDPPDGVFDNAFALSREMLDAGKSVVYLRKTSSECSDGGFTDVEACALTWSGDVSFTELSREVTEVEPPADPGPKTPAPASGDPNEGGDLLAPLVPVDPDADLLEPLVPVETAKALERAFKARLADGKASVQTVCPAACTGTMTVVAARGPQAARAGRGTRLGSAPLRVAGRPRATTAGGPQVVTASLPLRARALRTARRSGFVGLRTTIRVAGLATPIVVSRVVKAP